MQMTKQDNGRTGRQGRDGTSDRRLQVAPAVDIYENQDEILLVADLPGATPDGVTVKLDKEELHLHAPAVDEPRGESLHGAARAFDYRRTFLVPRGIDAAGIAADLKNGVLYLRLPKGETLKPRQIAVRAS